MDEPTKSVCYEIRVRGLLNGMLLDAFPDLRVQAHGKETVLTGPLADQAALYGCWPRWKRWASNCSKSAAPAAEPPSRRRTAP